MQGGVAVAVVGMGTPAQTTDFVNELRLPFPVLCDPSRDAYAAYGAIRMGISQMVNPKGAGAILGAVRNGHGGGKVVGDAMQLGGVWVISPNGTVLLARPSAYMGDHPSAEEIIAVVR